MRIRRRVIVRRRLLPRRVRHHPAARAAGAIVLALVVTSIMQRTAASAIDARRQWGEERTVVVARHRIAMGDVIESDSITTQSWPAALVPTGAVDSPPIGRTVVATIEPGEAVIVTRLAPDGLSGVAALVPRGWRALAIPVGPTVVALTVGDRVDLIAGFDVAGANADQAPAFTIAENAIVLAVDEQRVTVAVRDLDAERVAFAIVAGTVVPALRAT
ncbi:MAG: pilus assembly protein CpaB [Acidimicrobiaceae bacterium]|jgi:Flp pilus assembly protein CpaB